jgi:hypothetical protein
MIYNIITKEKGITFDPEMVDKFFKVMGVWPIGSIVGLSDGRVAVVTDEHEDDIFSPTVRVIGPQPELEALDLRQGSGSLRIERYLNPWTEGKEYLRLVQ